MTENARPQLLEELAAAHDALLAAGRDVLAGDEAKALAKIWDTSIGLGETAADLERRLKMAAS